MNCLGNTRKALDLASEKLSKADTFGAIGCIARCLEQIVAHLQGVDLNNHPDSMLPFTSRRILGGG